MTTPETEVLLPAVLEEHDALIPVTAQQIAVASAKALAAQITTDSDMEAGTDLARILRVMETKLTEARRRIVDPLNARVTAINAGFKVLTQPVLAGKEALKRRMDAYDDEVERLAALEAARLRKIEEDRVAEEAAALEEEARAKADEAEAAALEAKKLVEEGQLDQAETALEEAEAKAEEAEAKAEEALHTLDEGIDASAPLVATKQVHRGTFGGVSHIRKNWKHRLMDFAQVPREYLILDDPAIRKAIAAGTREIPGLEIYQERQRINR